MSGVDSPAAGTAPPAAGHARRHLRAAVARAASAVLLPMAQRVARDRIGGHTVADAISVARRLDGEGRPCTLGFWDTPDYSRQQVLATYIEAIGALTAADLDATLSIKPPAIGFEPRLSADLARAAAERGIGLHCDSHGTEAADASCAMIEAMLGILPADRLGTTLPGRWRRSLADADWAVERGLAVRVVKGQWPDPGDPGRDLGRGCLEVIDRLAGRARLVAVATHEVALLAAAIGRLRAAGTACRAELIHGAPTGAALDWAAHNGVDVRIYVPFGKGFLPNVIGMLRRDPRLALRIAKGLLGGRSGG